MTGIQRKVLQQLIEASAEPVLVARVDQTDWPVVLSNPAFDKLAGREPFAKEPFTDVVEQMHGRDTARELSETVRSGQASTIPLEYARRNWLMVLMPLDGEGGNEVRYYAAYWRDSAGAHAGNTAADAHQALLRARRRIRDLSRDDTVTGLLNAAAFRDVLTHDWSVAAREQATLALIAFSIDDFTGYVKVFGRHAADSCLRRVAQAIRRCLRRASDVAARLPHKDNDILMVLFHASGDATIGDFADSIAEEVRNLKLHHPHSRSARYVTVSDRTAMTTASGGDAPALRFLKETLGD
jgi:diguanylate cyclase (GGDEF)-like protein